MGDNEWPRGKAECPAINLGVPYYARFYGFRAVGAPVPANGSAVLTIEIWRNFLDDGMGTCLSLPLKRRKAPRCCWRSFDRRVSNLTTSPRSHSIAVSEAARDYAIKKLGFGDD